LKKDESSKEKIREKASFFNKLGKIKEIFYRKLINFFNFSATKF